MTGWLIIAAVLFAVAGLLLLSDFARNWLRFRGVRVITCPDNERPAAVNIDATRAASVMAVAGENDLQLRSCSRWPEMAGCRQECLTQITESADGCRLQSIVTNWYEGKSCAWCRQPVEKIVWHEHPPALRSPNGRSREWNEIKPQDLPDIFATHQAVCWRCHVLESFRRDHPELVIERPQYREPQPTLNATTAVY